jgi:8-oxo-dGTP pyrophosphatase MutT (NUDIX family)
VISKVGLTSIRDGKALLVRESDWNFIGFAGGSKKPGEDDIQCLERESLEEFELTLRGAKYLSTFCGESEENREKMEMRMYIVEFAGEPKATKEIEEIYWLGKDDYSAIEKLGKIDRSIIEYLIRKSLIK